MRKRRRRNVVGIQITVVSWILEVLAGIVHMSRYLVLQSNHESEWTDRLFVMFDIFVCHVLIPVAYLLNNEAIKILIQSKGWVTFFRSKLQQNNDLEESR